MQFPRLETPIRIDFVEASVDLPIVKKLLGHANISTTMRCAHPSPEHKKEAVQSLLNLNKCGRSAVYEVNDLKKNKIPIRMDFVIGNSTRAQSLLEQHHFSSLSETACSQSVEIDTAGHSFRIPCRFVSTSR